MNEIQRMDLIKIQNPDLHPRRLDEFKPSKFNEPLMPTSCRTEADLSQHLSSLPAIKIEPVVTPLITVPEVTTYLDHLDEVDIFGNSKNKNSIF